MGKIYCLNCMNEIEQESKFCKYCGKTAGECRVQPHYLPPNSLLRDRYLVGACIGEGGFGITYIGRDTVLDIKIAIKEFYPSGHVSRTSSVNLDVSVLENDFDEYLLEAKQKYLVEARVLAKFANDPGVVGVRDYFEENKTAYIIMDFVEGITLRQFVVRNGCFDASDLITKMTPLLKTLDKIHREKIIHRDISPENIMITPTGELRLLDFGAAREVIENNSRSFSIILKPGYAPEEQYRRKGNQGPWTDIYAICATMYYCISGVIPDDSMERLFDDEVKSLSQIVPACPTYLSDVIMMGMAVRVEDRYSNITALLGAFQNSSTVEQVQYHTIPERNYATKVVDDISKTEVPVKEDKKFKTIYIAPVLLIIGIILAVVLIINRSSALSKKADTDVKTEDTDSGSNAVGEDNADEVVENEENNKSNNIDSVVDSSVDAGDEVAEYVEDHSEDSSVDTSVASNVAEEMSSENVEEQADESGSIEILQIEDMPSLPTIGEEEDNSEVDSVSQDLSVDDSTNLHLEKLDIYSVRASSFLGDIAEDGQTYEPDNLIDGDYRTAWVDGKKKNDSSGDGVGEYIIMDLGGKRDVSKIVIYNGFLRTKYRYTFNGKVKRIQIEFDDGTTIGKHLDIRHDLGLDKVEIPVEDMLPTEIYLDQPVSTSWIKFTILEVEAGVNWHDTAISEIEIY